MSDKIEDISKDAAKKIKKAQDDKIRRQNRSQEAIDIDLERQRQWRAKKTEASKEIESTRVKKAAVNFRLTMSQQDKESEAQRLRDFSSNMTEEKKNSRLEQMKSYNQSHRTYSASTDTTGENVLYDIHRSCQTNKGMSSV